MKRFRTVACVALMALVPTAAAGQQGVNTVADAVRAIEGANGTPPKLLNLDELITADDYPGEAIDADEEGRVVVRVDVDAQGRMTDCQVVQSSGSAALDSQTCRLLWTRARFDPARDAKGRRIAASHTRSIAWRLESDPMPNEAWAMRLMMSIAGQGVATPSCKVEAEGAVVGHKHLLWACEDYMKGVPPELPVALPPGTRSTLILEERFVPASGEAGVPALPAGDVLLSREVLLVKVDASGEVVGCEAGAISGPLASPGEGCKQLEDRFVPRTGKDGRGEAFDATVIMTLAVRKETST